MDIVIAGTADAVMMVEGGGNEIAEEDFLGAVEFAHAEIRKIIAAIDELAQKGRQTEARVSRREGRSANWTRWVRKNFAKDVAKAMRTVDKQKREDAFGALSVDEALARCGKKDEAVKALLEDPGDGEGVLQDRQGHGGRRASHDGRRREDSPRRPQARRGATDLVQGALRPARARLGRLHARPDAGLHRRDAGLDERRAAARRHRRARRQALHALLQLSAVLGRRDAADARSRAARDRPRSPRGARARAGAAAEGRVSVHASPDERGARIQRLVVDGVGLRLDARADGRRRADSRARRRRRDGPDPQGRQVRRSSPTFRGSRMRWARWTSKSPAPKRASPRFRWTSRSRASRSKSCARRWSRRASRVTPSSTSSPRRSRRRARSYRSTRRA